MSRSLLLDAPIAVAVATWIWGDSNGRSSNNSSGGGGGDDGVTPELCLGAFPFSMSGGCWSQLMAKGVGIGIILLSCLNKAPIMLNIWRTKSTKGLSRQAVYGETLVYANCAAYGILERHPVSAYGENVSLLVQSIAIVALLWRHTDDPAVASTERLSVLAFAGAYLVTVGTSLPPHLHGVLMASVYPVQLYARGSQIFATYRIKHTGSLSIITTSMSLAGGLVRILTTIQEVGWDFAVLTGFLISVALNFVLFAQYLLYRDNTRKFVQQLQREKQKKKRE